MKQDKILHVTEIRTSVILILHKILCIFMPVDRELAYESLKWVYPKVYRAYLRLKYRELTDEEFQKDRISFYKFRMRARSFDSRL